jgi:hypothetical protein
VDLSASCFHDLGQRRAALPFQGSHNGDGLAPSRAPLTVLTCLAPFAALGAFLEGAVLSRLSLGGRTRGRMVRKLKLLVYSAISEIELIERRLRMNAI